MAVSLSSERTQCGIVAGFFPGGERMARHTVYIKCEAPYYTKWGGSYWVFMLLLTLSVAVSPIFLLPVLFYAIWIFISRDKVCSACGYMHESGGAAPDKDV
ncbi:MAG: hypothetical protein Q9M23_02915 [Mariprofundaceae bacterium]|nr:hypothetical protein [Mariprofundaceae bacterium]